MLISSQQQTTSIDNNGTTTISSYDTLRTPQLRTPKVVQRPVTTTPVTAQRPVEQRNAQPQQAKRQKAPVKRFVMSQLRFCLQIVIKYQCFKPANTMRMLYVCRRREDHEYFQFL